MSPPITARAIGARNSAPAPSASASGSMPKIIASVVITIGRSRIAPGVDERLVARSCPRSRAWLAKSTSRIAFLVTRPISRMRPIMLIMLNVSPRERAAPSITPTSDSGSESMIASGCRKRAELRWPGSGR